MAARTPRRSFAAPFVVTLAAVPACYVQTASPPPSPPPQSQPQQPPQQNPQGPVVMNPPRPMPPEQQPPPPSTTPSTTTDLSWTVFKGNEGSCMAAVKSECPPKATCNPPPPFKTACPQDVSLDKPVTVVSQDGGSTCRVEYPMPDCPKGVACNPPRPRPMACPTPIRQ